MHLSTRLLKPCQYPIRGRTPRHRKQLRPPTTVRYPAAASRLSLHHRSPPHALPIPHRLSFTSSDIPRSPRRLHLLHPLGPMGASGESSPKSTTSPADGFVHVSGDEISDAEEPTDDVNAESEVPEVDERRQNACSVDSAGAVSAGGPEASDAGASGGPGRRRVLPEDLSKGVVVLECESMAEEGSCDVYLVGTAHVSQESCREVQAIINFLKPEVVFLELCASRIAILAPQNLKQVPTMNEMIDMWKKKDANAFGILYSYFLAKVANKLEVFPGAEFRVAFEEARTYGAKVILGDRPVQITLRRTWGKMTLWHKAKFLYYIIFQSLFLPSPEDLNKLLKDLDDGDMLTLLIQEMSKAFPTLMETLLTERDMYMSSKLLNVAREHSSVVAVVGRGHLAGIKKHWKQPVQVKNLLEVPTSASRTSSMRILASLGVAVTGVAIISGIYLSCKRNS